MVKSGRLPRAGRYPRSVSPPPDARSCPHQIGDASTSRTLSPFCFSCSLVSPICIGLPSALIGSIHLRKTVIVTGVMMQLMAMISHSRSGSALQPAQSCSDQAPSKVLRIPIRESNRIGVGGEVGSPSKSSGTSRAWRGPKPCPKTGTWSDTNPLAAPV